MKLIDFYKTIYAPLILRSARPGTKRLYEITIRSFKKFLGREPLLHDLEDLTVSGYLSWHNDKGNTPHTIAKERDNILAIWRFAAREGHLTKWPKVPPQRLPKKIPEAWLEEEIRSLFAACDEMPGKYCNVPCPLFWKSLLLVIWDTGERISALMGVEWSDVNVKAGWIKVRAELRKGGNEDKLSRLGQDTISYLKEVQKHAKLENVFAWPYSATYLWNRFGMLLKRAGLEKKRAKFHKMRRSAASYYEAGGGNATELLGHSDRRITVQHYLDPRIIPQIKPACDVLFRPAG